MHARVFTDELPVFEPEKRSKETLTISFDPTSTPPCVKLRRFSPMALNEIQRQVIFLLEKRFFQPLFSPYGANVLLVRKENNTWRLCVAYRNLNRVTVKDKFPLPKLHDGLQFLTTAKYLSSLDLTQGYHQIPIDPNSRSKTAFRTTFGSFEWNVMPVGLTNAPATFQRLVNRLLVPYLNKFVLVYLDDILIFSATRQEHLGHLETDLKVLQQNHLTVKPIKSNLFKQKLRYLGVIDGSGSQTVLQPEYIFLIFTSSLVELNFLSPAEVRL